MPGRIRRHRRSTQIAALATGAVLTLGACAGSNDETSAGGSDAVAATVSGERITVGQVQRSSREVSDVVAAQAKSSGQPPQPVTPDSLITSLVQVPTILDYADSEGLSVPAPAAIAKQLDEVLPDPSERTVDFFRANAVYTQLDEDDQRSIAEALGSQDIDISPRYGSALGEAPNWLEASEPENPMEMP